MVLIEDVNEVRGNWKLTVVSQTFPGMTERCITFKCSIRTQARRVSGEVPRARMSLSNALYIINIAIEIDIIDNKSSKFYNNNNNNKI